MIVNNEPSALDRSDLATGAKLVDKEVGDTKFEVPEHDHELPTKPPYEIMPHRFLGQRPDHSSRETLR